MSNFKNWSSADLKNWVNNLTVPTTAKDAINKGIGDSVNGDMILACESEDDLIQALGVSKLTAKQLMANLKKCDEYNKAKSISASNDQQQQHQQQSQKTAATKFNESKMDDEMARNQAKSEEFLPTIKLAIGGIKYEKNHKISPNWTVERLKSWMKDHYLGGDSKVKEITLICNSKVMSDLKRPIKEYGCVSTLNTIVLQTRVIGGAQLPSTRIRKFDAKNPLIVLTDAPDCITYEDGDDELRAKMSCGHAFTAITMFTYVEHCFGKDLKFSEFVCPIKDCLKTWDWAAVAAVSNLTIDEFTKYSNLIEERQISTGLIKGCPHCKILVDKPEQLNQNRVHCVNCNGSDFCYLCVKKWNHSGLQICGNNDCETKVIEDTIKNCEDLVIQNYNQTIPRIRACPNCLTIITYDQACKHIKCPHVDCRHEFCFSCLQKWPCQNGKGNGQVCPPAARQQL